MLCISLVKFRGCLHACLFSDTSVDLGSKLSRLHHAGALRHGHPGRAADRLDCLAFSENNGARTPELRTRLGDKNPVSILGVLILIEKHALLGGHASAAATVGAIVTVGGSALVAGDYAAGALVAAGSAALAVGAGAGGALVAVGASAAPAPVAVGAAPAGAPALRIGQFCRPWRGDLSSAWAVGCGQNHGSVFSRVLWHKNANFHVHESTCNLQSVQEQLHPFATPVWSPPVKGSECDPKAQALQQWSQACYLTRQIPGPLNEARQNEFKLKIRDGLNCSKRNLLC